MAYWSDLDWQLFLYGPQAKNGFYKGTTTADLMIGNNIPIRSHATSLKRILHFSLIGLYFKK